MIESSPVIRNLLLVGSIALVLCAGLVLLGMHSQHGLELMVSFIGLFFWLGVALTFAAFVSITMDLLRLGRTRPRVVVFAWALFVLLGYGAVLAAVGFYTPPI